MSTYPSVVLLVIFVWWIGTGIVLRLQQGLNPDKFSTRLGILFSACISLCALQLSASNASNAGLFTGFVSAVVLWGCIELSYYLGQISGTHTNPCPKNVSGWNRFKLALGTSIWHELLVLSLGLLLIVVFYKAYNTVGLHTYMVLWLMRWSAKLNLFLGVPNFNTSWIPERLDYISTYIRTGSITPFFFISVLFAASVVVLLLSKSAQPVAAHPMMYVIPAVLLILAIVEHLFMLVPFQELKMWNRVFNSKS